jgi:superfamily II DNA or RNA helicase
MAKIQALMTQLGCLFSVKELETKKVDIQKAEKKLVIRKTTIRRGKNGKEIRDIKTAAMFRYIKNSKGDKFFCIPRFAPFELLGLDSSVEIVNKISGGKFIEPEKLESQLKLNENQAVIKKWLLEHIYCDSRIKKGRASCILVMGTGAGKTYMGLDLIRQFKKKTLIIVPSDAVMRPWRDALTFNFSGLIIGEYSCHKKKDGHVVIMVINSALRDTFVLGTRTVSKSTWFSEFGFVIYDEIHNYSSASFRQVFWSTNFKYTLGLTATPDMRADSMDDVYKIHIGSLIRGVDVPGYNPQLLKVKGLFVQPVKYHGPSEYTKTIMNPSTGTIWHLKMVQSVCQDPYRNQFVVEKMKKLLAEGRNVFVFFLERTVSTRLEDLLRKNKIEFENDNVKTLIGGAKNEDLEKAKRSRVILTTYGYGWQGISYVQMDAIIFLTSQKSELKQRQTMGRILGLRGDPNKDRIIYDIIDSDTPMRAQYYRRKKIYDDMNFTINEPEVINYTDIKI